MAKTNEESEALIGRYQRAAILEAQSDVRNRSRFALSFRERTSFSQRVGLSGPQRKQHEFALAVSRKAFRASPSPLAGSQLSGGRVKCATAPGPPCCLRSVPSPECVAFRSQIPAYFRPMEHHCDQTNSFWFSANYRCSTVSMASTRLGG